MDVKREDIIHLAQLSDFSISDEEVKQLTGDIQEIIAYVSQLDELDVSDIEPTYQVFEMENVWRADEIMPQDASREELIALAPESKNNQVKVPKVL